MPVEAESALRKHVKILGWLQISLGILDLLMGLAAFSLFTGVGVLSGSVQGLGAMALIGGAVGIYMLVMSLPNFIVGVGLLRNWGGWVIILAVILGIFNLFKFPWGTAIALYTFWIAHRLSAAA